MRFYQIKEVLNNSSVLVDDHGREVILVGRGIGFQQKKGNLIECNDQNTKKYYAVSVFEDNLDNQHVSQAADIVAIISELIECDIEGQALASLTNHLIAMLIRIEQDSLFDNPFHNETKALYASSYHLSSIAAAKIKQQTSIELPEAEIGFIALHIHNLLNEHDVSYNEITNAIISEVSEVMASKYKMKLNKESLTYARFVVHIKFMIQRIIRKESLEDLEIVREIFDLYEEYLPIAQDIAFLIESELNDQLSDNELAYLMLYIARLYAEDKTKRT